MNESNFKKYLEQYKNGNISEDDIIGHVKKLSTENLEFARIDHHRALRKGFPEVIYCEGKRNDQIKKIAESILKNNGIVLATRATSENYEYLKTYLPELVFYPDARIISTPIEPDEKVSKKKLMLIVSAGTADIPVAEEAAVTARVMGNNVKTIYDIGIAGIHRMLKYTDEFDKAGVIIVVAGMEGALASVVGGLTNRPVIAVPTSVGYGTSFGGLAALLSMLNSCASGVTVVNIDNGFGAGFAASLIVDMKSV